MTGPDAQQDRSKPWWRRRAVVSGAVTVLVLAVVITVFAAFSSTDPPPEVVVVRPATQQSQQAYSDAIAMLESGQTTRAAELLATAVRLDPSNTAAREELDKLTVQTPGKTPGKTPPKPSTTPTTQPPVDDSAFTKPVSPMTRLLPDAYAGYSLGAEQASKDSANVPGSPTIPGGEISRILWTVYDAGSESAAKSFVTKTSKQAFPNDAGTTDVDGVSAYTGTDGTRFAVVVYTRGRFVFETVATVVAGEPVAGLDVAAAAAKAFPEKP